LAEESRIQFLLWSDANEVRSKDRSRRICDEMTLSRGCANSSEHNVARLQSVFVEKFRRTFPEWHCRPVDARIGDIGDSQKADITSFIRRSCEAVLRRFADCFQRRYFPLLRDPSDFRLLQFAVGIRSADSLVRDCHVFH